MQYIYDILLTTSYVLKNDRSLKDFCLFMFIHHEYFLVSPLKDKRQKKEIFKINIMRELLYLTSISAKLQNVLMNYICTIFTDKFHCLIGNLKIISVSSFFNGLFLCFAALAEYI